MEESRSINIPPLIRIPTLDPQVFFLAVHYFRTRLRPGGGGGGGGGGEKFNQRPQEARPTRCRVEPARVSSPQVDLTRCGLGKTPTLLALQSGVGGGPMWDRSSTRFSAV